MARRSLEADRLEELLSGQASPDDAPRQLARLATLATTVRDHTSLDTPSDAFRTRLREELLAAPAAPPSLVDRTRDRVETATARWRHSLRVAGVSAVASAMIGATGVAAAAQSALPGDVLYSVKALTEDARLAFASGDIDRGRLHLSFALERLEEIEQGRDRLHPGQVVETLDRLDAEAAQGADEMLAAAAASEDGQPILDELEAFTAGLRVRLMELSADLPLSVHPATERTLELLRRIDLQMSGLLTPSSSSSSSSSSCEACADGQPRVVLPGDGPAVPSCDCVGGRTQQPAADADANDVGGITTSKPDPTTGSVTPRDPNQPDGVPSDDGGGVSANLDDTVSDLSTNLDTTVDDLGTNLGDTVGNLTTNLDDLGTTVEDTVDDLGTTVEDTVDGVGTTVDDAVDDVGTLVDDLLGDTGNLLDPSPSPSTSDSDPEGGLLGGLLD